MLGRGIWWIQNFKHLSAVPVSRLCLIKMMEGLENVWSSNPFTLKIQFCTCETLISGPPVLRRAEINLQMLNETLLIYFPFVQMQLAVWWMKLIFSYYSFVFFDICQGWILTRSTLRISLFWTNAQDKINIIQREQTGNPDLLKRSGS